MNSFVLDAPVFIARYTSARGYALIDQLLARASPTRLSCSVLCPSDVVAALVRLRRLGKLTAGSLANALLQFRWDVLLPAIFARLPLSAAQVEASLPLIETHQLDGAGGLLIRLCLDQAESLRPAGDDLILVSSSRRVLHAARNEGLLTFNPAVETQADLDALLGP
jgi:hypothetical protein